MSWTYNQATGELTKADNVLACGYAGKGDGKNNPSMEQVPNVGPLPKGLYVIGSPYDTKTHGPYVLRLTPDPDNEMFDRSGFLIHGDSVSAPGTASEGCIILPRKIREMIWNSGDNQLQVV